MTLSAEQAEFLRSAFKTMSGPEASKAFKDRYGVTLTVAWLKAWRRKNGIKSPFNGRFVKGMTSPNKGKPMPPDVYERCKATMFKKGMKPWNDTFKVGDRRIVRWKDGREAWFEKVSDDGTLWQRWKPVASMTMARAGKPVPQDCVIRHIDGNPLNDSIENLMVISKSVNGPLARLGIDYCDRETMESAVMIVKLASKRYRAECARRKHRCKKTV